MTRKILFVVFSDDLCRLNHVFMYALDLASKGHQARILVEGAATRMFEHIQDPELKLTRLFKEAQEKCLVVGSCKAASSGCANKENGVLISDLVAQKGVPLLSDMDGHAGIEKYVADGFEIVTI